MKRGSRDLETESDQKKGHRKHEQDSSFACRIGHKGCDRIDLGGSGQTVDESDPVEQKRRRKTAEQEVLDGRLVGTEAVPPDPDQHICAQRHQLEAQKQHDQVRSRRHERHAGSGQ
jgi:hypothetical protein